MDEIVPLLFLVSSGLILRFSLTMTGQAWAKSHAQTVAFLILPIVTYVITKTIAGNIALSLGMIGALSIVRFRTVIKDTKDIAFIFWSLAAGMGAGTGSYFISIVGTIFLVLIAIVLFKTNFGSIYKSEFILQFRYLKYEGEQAKYLNLIKQYARSHTLLNAEPSGDVKTIKLTFDILMKEDKDLNEFINEISKLKNVSEVSLTASKNDIDF